MFNVEGTRYKVKKVKKALFQTILPGLDYSLNPYFGCYHACIYCYARKFFLIRGLDYEWGEYIEIKSNIASVLAREVRRIPKGSVIGIGTSCDPYQPIEERMGLMRKILRVLMNRYDLTVEIQTKSTLILRDIDLLREFDELSVGFTIITANNDLGRFLEPRAPIISQRFEALRKLSDEGIYTWVFVGPILPYITDSEENLEKIVKIAKKIGVKKILSDKLRFRLGVRRSLVKALGAKFPSLIEKYKTMKSNEIEEKYRKSVDFLKKICKKFGVEFEDSSLGY